MTAVILLSMSAFAGLHLALWRWREPHDVLACLVALIALDIDWVRQCASARGRRGPLTCG